ncbi:hypothetical protein [Sphingomonas sp. RS2018]
MPKRAAPRGKSIPLGTITADLSRLPSPAAYELILELAGTPIRNRWSIWVYPSSPLAKANEGIVVTQDWAIARTALAEDKRVLFLSGNPPKPNPDLAMTTVPIFWNRLMNPSRAWMLGLLNDVEHHALAGFPTEAHCDWQWVDLIEGTTAMNIEALDRTIRPIVQPIDDWNRSLRTALAFDVRVGGGRLMVSAFDLSEDPKQDRPGRASLRRSLIDHMTSERFSPLASQTLEQLDDWVLGRHTAPTSSIVPHPSNDVVDPGQLRR